MKVTQLPRVFLYKVNGQDIRLNDPNTKFNIAQVQQFFAATYPILTNAKVTGPEVKDKEQQYRFESAIGTKG